MGERAAAWAAERGHALIEVIALDGDDTLWHSEHLFVDTQDRFRDLVRPYVDLDDAGLDERLLEVERRNLPLFGYGVKAFTLSLVETAIEVTDGRIPGADLQAVLDLGKVLIDHPVELLDGVREAVDALTDRYRVMVITKGDLLHQETKVARSGLAELFWRVEIVSEKDEATYAPHPRAARHRAVDVRDGRQLRAQRRAAGAGPRRPGRARALRGDLGARARRAGPRPPRLPGAHLARRAAGLHRVDGHGRPDAGARADHRELQRALGPRARSATGSRPSTSRRPARRSRPT